ncbi:MAG: helix-turn-helix domain-containing protein [Patescibacteria group bacterium]
MKRQNVTEAAFFEDGLVPIPDAARFLGLGITKVYELMGKGQLPFVLIDRSRRIRRSDLRRFVEERRRGGQAAS